jgi:RNA-directed DNA polymerase
VKAGKQTVRQAVDMWVKDCRKSECRFVMKRIGVETLPHTKVGRLLRQVILYKKFLELLKAGKQMNVIKTTCAPADQIELWNRIDRNKCEGWVRKLQARTVKTQQAGKHGKVKALQWLLTHSYLAIKRVTSNSGSKTAGGDKVLWTTTVAKIKATGTLKRRGYTLRKY